MQFDIIMVLLSLSILFRMLYFERYVTARNLYWIYTYILSWNFMLFDYELQDLSSFVVVNFSSP